MSQSTDTELTLASLSKIDKSASSLTNIPPVSSLGVIYSLLLSQVSQDIANNLYSSC